MTLFYARPSALNADAHAAIKLRPRSGFQFAGTTNAIPVAASEFAGVQAHYPIVFSAGATPSALAIVGLRDNENLFVEEDGSWRREAFVPAYVRRYPFGLARIEGSDRYVLAFDEAAAAVSTTDGSPLFDDRAPTETTRRAMAFCTEYARLQRETTAFVAALVEADLLIERSIEWRMPGRDGRFAGFKIVDPVRFKALASDRVIAWHENGWLGLVHAHLASMLRWRALAAMTAGAEPPDRSAIDSIHRSDAHGG